MRLRTAVMINESYSLLSFYLLQLCSRFLSIFSAYFLRHFLSVFAKKQSAIFLVHLSLNARERCLTKNDFSKFSSNYFFECCNCFEKFNKNFTKFVKIFKLKKCFSLIQLKIIPCEIDSVFNLKQ